MYHELKQKHRYEGKKGWRRRVWVSNNM